MSKVKKSHFIFQCKFVHKYIWHEKQIYNNKKRAPNDLHIIIKEHMRKSFCEPFRYWQWIIWGRFVIYLVTGFSFLLLVCIYDLPKLQGIQHYKCTMTSITTRKKEGNLYNGSYGLSIKSYMQILISSILKICKQPFNILPTRNDSFSRKYIGNSRCRSCLSSISILNALSEIFPFIVSWISSVFFSCCNLIEHVF